MGGGICPGRLSGTAALFPGIAMIPDGYGIGEQVVLAAGRCARWDSAAGFMVEGRRWWSVRSYMRSIVARCGNRVTPIFPGGCGGDLRAGTQGSGVLDAVMRQPSSPRALRVRAWLAVCRVHDR